MQLTVLPDQRQSAWQLASIQLTGVVSLPIILSGLLLLQGHSPLSSFVNILAGNILLWLIRLGMVQVSYPERLNTLEVAQLYIGTAGRYLVAGCLILSSVSEFFTVTTIGTSALTVLAPIDEGAKNISLFTQYATIFGVASTALCIEGIKMLRWVAVITLPFLLLSFAGVVVFSSSNHHAVVDNGISLSGIWIILATNLGVTADLPTFFRHGRSIRACRVAVSLIQIISFLIGIGTIYIGSEVLSLVSAEGGPLSLSLQLTIAVAMFVLISVVVANVANVYSASVAWELFAPRSLTGRQEYLLLGFLLSLIFLLLSGVIFLEPVAKVTDGALVNLSVVILVGAIISRLIKIRITPSVRICYLVGWVTALIFLILRVTGAIEVAWSVLIFSFFILPVFCLICAAVMKVLTTQDGPR